MCVSISSLNSGSNGNCYYIGNQNEAVLVDAGLSCREIEKRLKRLGIAKEIIKAIFISHEHSDHIKGISILSQKYRLPVYITPKTLLNGRLALEKKLVKTFTEEEPVVIGSLSIQAFSKHHDAADPYSFVITCQHTRVGVFTDIGRPCKNLIHHFKLCHAVFLESNYDEDMLNNGSYPYHLKARIKGGNGHLSNRQALEVFQKYRSPFLTHLFLSHLSDNNNCPKLVEALFKQHAGQVNIVVASRFIESSLYLIEGKGTSLAFSRPAKKAASQLAFSF